MSSPASTRPATSPRARRRRSAHEAPDRHSRPTARPPCPPSRRNLARKQRRKRDRSARLDHEPMPLPGEADRLRDFGIADRQRSRLPTSQDSEGDRRHARRLNAHRRRFPAHRRATGTISPSSSERAMSSQPSGSTITISASGQASAMPEASPPPPQGTTIRVGAAPQLLDDLEARSPLAGDDRRIVEARHHGRSGLARRSARRSPRGSRCRRS